MRGSSPENGELIGKAIDLTRNLLGKAVTANRRAHLHDGFSPSALRFEGASSLELEENRSLLNPLYRSLGADFRAALDASCWRGFRCERGA